MERPELGDFLFDFNLKTGFGSNLELPFPFGER
jgi:hypothetical protein